ncbi:MULTISPECIES: aminoglycoside phosphotransferase family protein [unclassified Clostridium]|uniref:phosphotransferase family protein n=1 Tax=unclassified Clostridium TaxID=2614128 RepID=UPI00029751D7|nr:MULTISPECIES: aminoglycoside phosphotransferase family protein [unclassified Clostridium]EKQ57405.1 MAG: putative aminoglycoside phosphotransferase [Clostridium sp. Maddingley MBC34-26]
MVSITKTKVINEQIIKMTKRAFGEDVVVKDIIELKGGFFNAAYIIVFNGEQKVVLKISPIKELKVMRYENNIMETEVFVLNKMHSIEDIPVPKVLYYDKSNEIIECEFLFMEFVDGISLNEIRNKLTEKQFESISSDLVKIVRKINEIEGEYFGSISQENKRFSTWFEAFFYMIKELLEDAEDAGISFPFENNKLYKIIKKHSDALNKVTKPLLIHKDLWEGNIIIDPRTIKIVGVLDCERAIFGDPLLEPICGYFWDNKNLMNAFVGREDLNKDEYIRFTLYKIYLYLIEVIECTYRQYPGEDRDKWARSQINQALKELEKIHLKD